MGAVEEKFPIISQASAWDYEVTINDTLEKEGDFSKLIKILKSASQYDTVTINLNSDGGDLDSVYHLLSAMEQTEALIKIVVSGTVASAATLLLFHADVIEVSAFSTFLFHSIDSGIWGKTQDIVEFSGFLKEHNEKLFSKYYSDFFTEEEIKDIITNKREYLMAEDEFLKRMGDMLKLRNSDLISEEDIV